MFWRGTRSYECSRLVIVELGLLLLLWRGTGVACSIEGPCPVVIELAIFLSLRCGTGDACSYEGTGVTAVELVAPFWCDSLVTFAGPRAMEAIQASGEAKPTGFSSLCTVLASARPSD